MIENALSQEEGELILKFENEQQKRKFSMVLDDVLSDRGWCYEHGIDYLNPSTQEAAKILYKTFSNK